ncbi:MAG: YnfA family protein [Bacteroidota bacterium]
MNIVKSILFFLIAGLFEIIGGYLVWIWIKNDKPLWYGLAGILLLALYGFIPTLQSSNFGRIYAAYGGVFIILSLLWGWKVDGFSPDKQDVLGALICLIGITVIMIPRK